MDGRNPKSEVNQVRSLLMHDLQLLPHQQIKKKALESQISPFSRKKCVFFLVFCGTRALACKEIDHFGWVSIGPSGGHVVPKMKALWPEIVIHYHGHGNPP